MKVSIVISVLESHEIFRRQCLYWEKIGIPEDTEIIIVDDGSEVPITYSGKLPIKVIYTNDKRPWTASLARNRGAEIANGEYLLMFDLDHFISRPLLDFVRNFKDQKIQFKREFAILDENGNFSQDLEEMVKYGYPRERFALKGFYLNPHQNQYAMRKDIFFKLGKYREDLVELPYPQGEDMQFKKKWYKWERDGHGRVTDCPHHLYMFPCGYLCGNKDVDFNPNGLFHTLSRKSSRNKKYLKQMVG